MAELIAHAEDRRNLQTFINDRCVLGPYEADSVACLWSEWCDWATNRGEWIGTKRGFADRLRESGFTPRKLGKASARGYRGLRLRREKVQKEGVEKK